MKQIEVQIMGQSYLLGCPDGGEAQLREAVERVDAAMCKIRDAGKVKARDRIAVLASLNLAFDLAALEQQQRAAATVASAPEPVPVAAPAVTAPAAIATSDGGETDARARQLMQRLDQALAGDGHLL
jgi:cell division protein ZapA